ncbi:hypothetical protein BY458DRAFT_286674 [Sporodiniella umbellata]|nr:hypothetical protein BY458DRAFT_286674 [Sporodiniella umbellata]
MTTALTPFKVLTNSITFFFTAFIPLSTKKVRNTSQFFYAVFKMGFSLQMFLLFYFFFFFFFLKRGR